MLQKTCSKCLVTKDTSCFHKRGSKWQPMCKDCKKLISKQRYVLKGGAILAKNKKWRDDNPDKMRQARASWVSPKSYGKAKRAYHRALKLTDVLDTFDILLRFYQECPDGYEVDHIQPLSKGGSHTLSNLQYLTIHENRKKANKWEGGHE